MAASSPQATPRRIGIMDWGIGGLGFYRLLKRAAPDVACVYLSDSGAPPYGTLPPRVLAQQVARAAAWFSERGVSQLVVACNAASSVLDRVSYRGALRAAPAPTLLGVIEPTLRALLRERRCSVGVFGGRRTVRSLAYRTPLLAAGFDVRQRIAQPLSALVEAGRISGPRVEREIERILQPIAGCELLVPACTHYAALLPLFRRIAPGARFLDPAELALEEVLAQRPRARSASGKGESEFWTTGSPAAFERGAARAFALEILGARKLRELPRG